MKRVRKIIFNGLTVLSLLLCVATVVLWVRSYSAWDTITWEGQFEHAPVVTHRYLWLSSTLGHLEFQRVRQQLPEYAMIGIEAGVHFEVGRPPTQPQLLSFHHDFEGDATGYSNLRADVPYWFVVLLASVLPVARVVFAAVRRRIIDDHCGICGYDLRATQNRCPECGTPVAAKAAS